MSKYGSFTIVQLKEELKKRNAKQSGRKHELVERLDAYDRNFNFKSGIQDAPGHEFEMMTPAAEQYKDLHGGTVFPELILPKVRAYLEPLNRSIDKKAENLYKARFVNFVRVAHNDSLMYIKAQCRAEMKKHIIYLVDISMDTDGMIAECQCECAAGMGPTAHCKHVCTILYGLVQFTNHGEFKIHQTCTQKLQTFHATKSHLGSPVKAQNLQMSMKHQGNLSFDPIPCEYRYDKGYNDYFRNLCLNQPSIQQRPLFHLIQPANPYAVSNDHDYCRSSPEDLFLQQLLVTTISNDQASEIEAMTRQQSNKIVWMRERTKRIGSSSFGRICLATERTNFTRLAAELTEVQPDLNVPAVLYGKKYEMIAVSQYEHKTGCKTRECGIFVSKTHPFLASSPDRVVSEDLIIEVKCPYSAKDKKINCETVPYLQQGESGKFDLNRLHPYYYQVQGQLFCSESDSCDFVIFTLNDMQIIQVKRNDEFITEMVQKLKTFFDAHFKQALLNKHFYKDYKNYSFM